MATPAHQAAPQILSERATDGDYYLWHLSTEERSHIVSLLECTTSQITTKSTKMIQDRASCSTCAKPSGLDDLVQNALAQGIHTREFMLDVLVHGPKNDSPGHVVFCSGCGTKFEGKFLWIPSSPW